MKAQQEMMAARGFITPSAAAEKIGVSVGSVYAMVNNGQVKGMRVGRSWYVELASLRAYLGPAAAMLLGPGRTS